MLVFFTTRTVYHLPPTTYHLPTTSRTYEHHGGGSRPCREAVADERSRPRCLYCTASPGRVDRAHEVEVRSWGHEQNYRRGRIPSSMPERLYFTDPDEANELIAKDP